MDRRLPVTLLHRTTSSGFDCDTVLPIELRLRWMHTEKLICKFMLAVGCIGSPPSRLGGRSVLPSVASF